MKQRSEGQLFFGLFILILGVLALVDNLNLFYMRNVLHFWPIVFILFGVLKLRQSGTGKQRLWPVLFIALGSLMTLDNMGIIHFQIHEWWPAILIAIGVKIVFFDRKKADGNVAEWTNQTSNADDHLDITAILGGSENKITSQDFRFGDITAIMGGAELDFRQANIVDQAVLDITAVMGGVVLKVPREWIVVNQIGCFMGGAQDKSMPAVDATKRLIVTGTAIMGGIEIKN